MKMPSFKSQIPNVKWMRRIAGRFYIRFYKNHLLLKRRVIACERDEALKERVVAKYMSKRRYKRSPVIKKAKECSIAVSEKSSNKIFTDMVFCRLAYGFTASEYIQFDLADKPYEQRRTFYSDLDRYIFAYHVSDICDMSVFHNKIRTYEHFSRFYKRDLVPIKGQGDLDKYLEFIGKHPVFVKKDALGMAGEGVELVDITKCGKTPEQYFAAILKEGWTVLEECIVQGEEMARFNPSSINTVRCVAMSTRHGIITPYCCLRTGRSGSFVDNASSGGLLALVDPETGVVSSDGFDRNNFIQESHPDTGVRFKGFQLPEWQEMLTAVREMMQVLPSVKYVGWDMAHTDKGWVMIEGNCMGQLMAPQFRKETGIRDDILGYMKDMDLMVPLKNGSF